MLGVAVRVRLRIKSRRSGAEVQTTALVNSGFESATPQLLLPVNAARQISLYPPPPDATVVDMGTAGGPARMFLIRNSIEVWVLSKDRMIGPKLADVLISPLEEEVLINDKLSEELGIMLIAIGSGKWRFLDDGSDKIRYSEKPQYW